MKHASRSTKLVFLAGLFGLALVFVFAVPQIRGFLAQRRLQDLEWLETASPSELRATAHQALEFRFGDPHDAFAMLQMHGDRSSIAVLRAALRRQPDPRDGIECTWAHGHDALERALKLPP